jgi:hypothetical protein
MGKEKVIGKINNFEKAIKTLQLAILKNQQTPQENEN